METRLKPKLRADPSHDTVHIICGPSSAGKSSFIRKVYGGAGKRRILLANELSRTGTIGAGSVVHYNTLRVLDNALASWKNGANLQYGRNLEEPDFTADPAWRMVLECRALRKATLVLTPEAAFLERLAKRKFVEPDRSNKVAYPTKRWLTHFRLIDLEAHYRAWIDELQRAGIPHTIVDGTSPEFAEIEDVESALARINLDMTRIPATELGKLTNAGELTYQSIDLKRSNTIRGADARDVFDDILPPSLAGDSLLDVGCAEGVFCLEAKKRGANFVHGIDIRPERLGLARIEGRASGIDADFSLRDIQRQPIGRQYDHILLLNVIHHLDQPFQVLKNLANSTTKSLVIEFPGLYDVKFGATVSGLPDGLDALPLIGVSMLDGADQTFVYSPAAIERLMRGPPYNFSRVDISGSKMEKRFLAICRR